MLTLRPSGTSARIPSVDELRRRNGPHSHPLTLRIDPPGPFKWRQLYWPPTLERAINTDGSLSCPYCFLIVAGL
jgi:hypothetical protein